MLVPDYVGQGWQVGLCRLTCPVHVEISEAPLRIIRICGSNGPETTTLVEPSIDTLLGSYLEPFLRTRKRRSIKTSKSYYFDCGVTNSLLKRSMSPKTPEFGKVFEQFMVLDVPRPQDRGIGRNRANSLRIAFRIIAVVAKAFRASSPSMGSQSPGYLDSIA